MKMSKKKISLLLLISISLLLINTNTVRADEIWEYTFDDEDSLDNWNINYVLERGKTVTMHVKFELESTLEEAE